MKKVKKSKSDLDHHDMIVIPDNNSTDLDNKISVFIKNHKKLLANKKGNRKAA